MKHILVTTDFSPCSLLAFDAAREMQQLFQSKLTIVSVIEPNNSAALHAQHGIEVLRETYFKNVPCRSAIIRRETDVPTDITAFARHHATDLIIIASHGHTGLERIRFGSVAEQLLREAPCPVLVVPASSNKPARERQCTHLVVTTDLSPASEAALPLARKLYSQYGSAAARLTLLHIAENMVAATFGNPLGGSAELIRNELEWGAEKAMRELQQRYFAGTLATTAVIRGRREVHEEIIDYAHTHDADLIILASHGHSALENLLLGSVTAKLVRFAERRILALPNGITHAGR